MPDDENKPKPARISGLATGARHTFQAAPEFVELTARLVASAGDAGAASAPGQDATPLDGWEFEATKDGRTHTGKLDADGHARVWIGSARRLAKEPVVVKGDEADCCPFSGAASSAD